jgi:1-deoxy-D-xylulose-5-phosphate reductoisomerase
MLGLGIAAGKLGGAAPAVYNAANEVAVAHFLRGTVRFGAIATLVADALTALESTDGSSLEALIAADRAARQHVHSRVEAGILLDEPKVTL